MSKTTPAARASRAAAATSQTRKHLKAHRDHREKHEALSLTGGAILGGERHQSLLAAQVVAQHGTRIPLTPKEAAALDSLIADHPDVSAGLTRRDPGETGPLLASFGDATYLIDGQTVTKVA